MAWVVAATIWPRLLSETSTSSSEVRLALGATLGALFVEALGVRWQRRRHAADARSKHVELGGDSVGGHG
jgi:hypothetical protein